MKKNLHLFQIKDTNSGILKAFENLPIEKRNKIEEKAILLYSSIQSISSEFLEILKDNSKEAS